LRERQADIIPLASHFVAEFTHGKARFSATVTAAVEQYSWPGNVRELRNAMERASLMSHGELILPEHLPARIRQATQESAVNAPNSASRLEEIERLAIIQALREHNFNRTETARVLGISRRALTYKIQRFKELGYEVDSN